MRRFPMARRSLMAALVASALCLPAAAGLAASTGAREPDGSASPANGKRLAQALCGDCHSVVPGSPGGLGMAGPDLVERVQDPAITELALRSYLRTSHPIMPNVMPNREETDDIVAYLLSLKENRR
ncbi:cytochrome c [Azospirillum sp. TSO35-2]|uniref:c-type cytochrome n=1 Tax=Azospirillum sp. TSO35-2 TaxID=716796 RepID=UPI0011B56543|nr:cytochrome c [Azospirillum sp. TSO35-2]